jgi:hypothetical protein
MRPTFILTVIFVRVNLRLLTFVAQLSSQIFWPCDFDDLERYEKVLM